MTTQDELRTIIRKLPRDVPPFRPVVLSGLEHANLTATYGVRVPMAGTLLGVRFPRGFPRSKLLGLWWATGEQEDAIVGGDVPLKAARKLRMWCSGGEQLRVAVGLPEGTRVRELMAERTLLPYSLLVPPVQSGAVETGGWQNP